MPQHLNTSTLRPPGLLPDNTPLMDDCHHLRYGGDLDTRTPLPDAAGNLVLIQQSSNPDTSHSRCLSHAEMPQSATGHDDRR